MVCALERPGIPLVVARMVVYPQRILENDLYSCMLRICKDTLYRGRVDEQLITTISNKSRYPSRMLESSFTNSFRKVSAWILRTDFSGYIELSRGGRDKATNLKATSSIFADVLAPC